MPTDSPTEFAHFVSLLRERFSFSVTSWWRSPGRNARVGGAPTSKHLRGLAMDLVISDPADQPALVRLAESYGLTVVAEGDHLHVQALPPEGPAVIPS